MGCFRGIAFSVWRGRLGGATPFSGLAHGVMGIGNFYLR